MGGRGRFTRSPHSGKSSAEENNVIDQFPEIVADMQKVLDGYRAGKGSAK